MLDKTSKISVVGAGAVGCFFGGVLASHGLDVTLIARETHVQAINGNGLIIDYQQSTQRIALNAETGYESLQDADLVFLCVKSPDTAKVSKEIASYLKKNTVILSLQNGVDNVYRAGEVLSQDIFPAVVYVAVGMAGPGRVKHFGRGELVLGAMQNIEYRNSQILQQIATLFTNHGVPTTVSEHIKDELWLKFLVNCIYNGISAIGQIEYGQMVEIKEVNDFIENLTHEFLLIAKAEGARLSWEQAMLANQKIAQTMKHQKSSTSQDLLKKKVTEIEFLNGYIVKKGLEFEIPTPSHQALYAMVKMLEHINTLA